MLNNEENDLNMVDRNFEFKIVMRVKHFQYGNYKYNINASQSKNQKMMHFFLILMH